jgi:hypothetical protein
VRRLRLSIVFSITLGLLAAGRAFTPYDTVKPILSQGPAELRNADESEWLAWAARHDRQIRARVEQGDLDSMVNLLLYGTSFTKQPRISMEGEGIAQASRAGVLRARVDDLVAGLESPGNNERLVFLRGLLRRDGVDTDDPKSSGVFVLQNLQRVVQERKTLAERAAAAKPSSPLDRASLFRDRGLSLDTGIFPDFAIEQSLRDLQAHGVLREGQVSRVAVIGPGLDFIDKSEASAYDYYPEQTLQPFALYDSLLRLGLARANHVSMSIFDINPQVIQHLERARERAGKSAGYIIQLPHNAALLGPPQLAQYWKSLGDQVGTAIAPIAPPRIFQGLETRAVRIRPDVVLACDPIDLNIVLERQNLAAADQFDLIVATNIFVYYDTFEQSLALQNAGAMLKPGGLLLTNDRLPVVPGGSMRLAGVTLVPLDSAGVSESQAVGWYRKQ